jgi:hypothetical protein
MVVSFAEKIIDLQVFWLEQIKRLLKLAKGLGHLPNRHILADQPACG